MNAKRLLLLSLSLSLPLVCAASFDSPGSSSRQCRTELSGGWRACRAESRRDGSCTKYLLGPQPSLPTTALATLLAAGELQLPKGDDPYFSHNLAHIPDINVTGASFYTLTWERQMPVEQLSAECREQQTDRAWLRLEGVNYRAARASLGGLLLPTPPPGMFIGTK